MNEKKRYQNDKYFHPHTLNAKNISTRTPPTLQKIEKNKPHANEKKKN